MNPEVALPTSSDNLLPDAESTDPESTDAESTNPAEVDGVGSSADTALVVEDLLVEEVSIDGMCGVY